MSFLLVGGALAALTFAELGTAPPRQEVAPPAPSTVERSGEASPESLADGPAHEARVPVEAAPEPNSASPAPGVRGRVIDVRTGEGVGGCTVMLSLPEKGREQFVTESDGEFAFDVDPDGVGLFARAPEGWRWRVAGGQFQWLPTLPREADGGLVVELAENRTGPVRGVAVDALSGEALPGFRFTLQSGRFLRAWGPVEVVTREDGTFVTEPIPGGPLRIPRSPAGEAVVSDFDLVTQDEDDEPLRLEFVLPNQIELELVGEVPADVSQLKVQAMVPVASTSAWVPIAAPWRTLVTGPVERLVNGRLRVPLHEEGMRAGQDCLLVVTDELGHWFGCSPHRWKSDTAPVRVSMEQTAALAIDWERVLPEGASWSFRSSASYPQLALRSEGVEAAPLWAWRQQQRRWLPPGPYELSAVGRSFRPIHEDLDLVAGATSEVALELVPDDDTRAVLGEVRGEPGASLSGIEVTLALLEPGAGGFRATENGSSWCGTGIDHSIVIEEDGVGRFRFDGVRRGAFEVRVSRPAAVTTTELEGGEVSIDVLVLAESTTEGLGFEVELEPPLAANRFGVYVLEGGRLKWLAAFYPGELVTRERRLAPGVQWAVVSLAGGAQPAYGTDRDFVAATDARRIAEVRLRPGWGTRVLVLDERGRALPEAEVLVDGESLGFTAEDGSLEVRRDEPPVRLEARLAGWRPREGVFPPVTTQGRRPLPWHPIFLERR